MIKLILAFCAITLFASCNSQFASNSAAPKFVTIEHAQMQFRTGDYKAAFASYKSLRESGYADVNVLLGYAASADMLGKFDISDDLYRTLQPSYGNRAEYLNNLAFSLLLRDRTVDAYRVFLKAQMANKNIPEINNNIAFVRSLIR